MLPTHVGNRALQKMQSIQEFSIRTAVGYLLPAVLFAVF